MPKKYRYVPSVGFEMIKENFAAHYGVPGMRWGFRKDGSSGSSRRKSTPKASSMSDADLQKAVQRINLEKQYKSLTKTPGQKAGDVVAQVVKTAVVSVATKYAIKGVKAAVQKAIEG
jgi:hypothetical protein